MDIREHNRLAWDRHVERGCRYTIPAGPEEIAAARRGEWTIYLTPTKPLPRDWLPDVIGQRVLCLASGGGQQGPVLAAAGARVTVFDNSPRQLESDRLVADREGLEIETVEGDMADLRMFSDLSFDIIVHPVSNAFVPDVRPVWREAYRVLRLGGALVSGFGNPAVCLFDYSLVDRTGKLEVKYVLPYSDTETLSESEMRRYKDEGIPFEFSHSLEDQIGGQIAAGFVITGLYEDHNRAEDANLLSNHMPTYIATRASKPREQA